MIDTWQWRDILAFGCLLVSFQDSFNYLYRLARRFLQQSLGVTASVLTGFITLNLILIALKGVLLVQVFQSPRLFRLLVPRSLTRQDFVYLQLFQASLGIFLNRKTLLDKSGQYRFLSRVTIPLHFRINPDIFGHLKPFLNHSDLLLGHCVYHHGGLAHHTIFLNLGNQVLV
jgi:hypothetical protein